MTNRHADGGVSDVAVLVVIGGAFAAAVLVWLWGGIAGALFGDGWPRVGAGELLGVLTRLPSRLSDPRRVARRGPRAAARPRRVLRDARRLVAAVVLVVSLAVVPGGWPRAGGVRTRAGARWAGAGELRVLRGRSGPDARLTLGRHHGRLLHAEHRHALVAFGPPQSGKSSGLAIPALLEWHGPAVASSIKTDLLDATRRRRESLGRAFVFDPFALAGGETHTWSPLTQAVTWDGALEVAWRLACAGEVDQRGVDGGDFWAIAAEQRLAPLLYTAAATGRRIESRRPLGVRSGRPGAARVAREARTRGPRRADDRRRPCRLRRGARVRRTGRPHAQLDRGNRAGAAARVPLHSRRAVRGRCRNHR